MLPFARKSQPRQCKSGLYFIAEFVVDCMADYKKSVDSRRLGYPKVAAFVDSDRDFAIFRSFGELYTRLLLHKQDELSVLQKELETLDSNEASAFFLCSRQADRNQDRILLFCRIETKLNEYGEIYLKPKESGGADLKR